MAGIDPKLLADILERPLDDAPRLVAADALQEKGDPRGYFIVAQCRLAERGLPRDERTALKVEVQKLLAKHASEWAAPAKDLDEYQMRRGFIDEVSGSASDLAKTSAVLFSTEPITRLTITDPSAGEMATLAENGSFARVLRLTVRGSLGDEGARTLADALAERRAPLTSLNVGGAGIGAEGVVALVAALKGCRSLALTSNALGDEGLAAIAKAKTLSGLETLFLTDNDLTDAGVEALAASTGLGALVRLSLARNEEVTREGLGAIAKSKKLKRLRWLEYTDEDGLQNIVTRAGR